MSEKGNKNPKMKTCKACGKEVAKSVKKCPHCGQKLKMGLFLKGLIGIGILIFLIIVLQPSEEKKEARRLEVMKEITETEPANLSSVGELAEIFKMGSKFTDIQRDNKEKEITGQIVQWELPVYEVKKSGENYRIQTSGSSAIMGMGVARVGTFITVYPRNDQESQYIENLKTDDIIKFKGKITGTTMRNIDINPAVLIKLDVRK